jgi:uncharacterized protein (DUF433 family)
VWATPASGHFGALKAPICLALHPLYASNYILRGMRLTVRRVVEAVAIYPNRDDLFRNYPELEPEDVRQALAFAAASLEDSATESSAA